MILPAHSNRKYAIKTTGRNNSRKTGESKDIFYIVNRLKSIPFFGNIHTQISDKQHDADIVLAYIVI